MGLGVALLWLLIGFLRAVHGQGVYGESAHVEPVTRNNTLKLTLSKLYSGWKLRACARARARHRTAHSLTLDARLA